MLIRGPSVDHAHREYLEILKYRRDQAFKYLYRVESREMELFDEDWD